MNERIQSSYRVLVKRTRIVTSLLFLVVCVVLLALWVRSFKVKDITWIRYSGDDFFRISSYEGRLTCSIKIYRGVVPSLSHSCYSPSRATKYKDDYGKTPNSWWFQILRWRSGLIEFHMPLWFLTVITGMLSGVIAARRRFSLRTFLIAISLLTIIIGIAARSHPKLNKNSRNTLGTLLLFDNSFLTPTELANNGHASCRCVVVVKIKLPRHNVLPFDPHGFASFQKRSTITA